MFRNRFSQRWATALYLFTAGLWFKLNVLGCWDQDVGLRGLGFTGMCSHISGSASRTYSFRYSDYVRPTLSSYKIRTGHKSSAHGVEATDKHANVEHPRISRSRADQRRLNPENQILLTLSLPGTHPRTTILSPSKDYTINAIILIPWSHNIPQPWNT